MIYHQGHIGVGERGERFSVLHAHVLLPNPCVWLLTLEEAPLLVPARLPTPLLAAPLADPFGLEVETGAAPRLAFVFFAFVPPPPPPPKSSFLGIRKRWCASGEVIDAESRRLKGASRKVVEIKSIYAAVAFHVTQRKQTEVGQVQDGVWEGRGRDLLIAGNRIRKWLATHCSCLYLDMFSVRVRKTWMLRLG